MQGNKDQSKKERKLHYEKPSNINYFCNVYFPQHAFWAGSSTLVNYIKYIPQFKRKRKVICTDGNPKNSKSSLVSSGCLHFR